MFWWIYKCKKNNNKQTNKQRKKGMDEVGLERNCYILSRI